jgi:hypothetical protein
VSRRDVQIDGRRSRPAVAPRARRAIPERRRSSRTRPPSPRARAGARNVLRPVRDPSRRARANRRRRPANRRGARRAQRLYRLQRRRSGHHQPAVRRLEAILRDQCDDGRRSQRPSAVHGHLARTSARVGQPRQLVHRGLHPRGEISNDASTADAEGWAALTAACPTRPARRKWLGRRPTVPTRAAARGRRRGWRPLARGYPQR